jgi:hypothetical protein
VRDRRPRHDRRNGPGPEDADLGARLERALRGEHGDQHVDVARLLRNTRQATTKRTRTRRFTALAAAGVAAASIPVGLQIAQWSAPSAAPPASQVTSSPTPPPAEPTPSPRATGTPEAERVPGKSTRSPETDGPAATENSYDIPDAVAIPAEELPASMLVFDDFGQYPKIPTVAGQTCSEVRAERLPGPIAGRQWKWSEEASNRNDQWIVHLTVSGWRSGTAERALADVAKNTGACRFRAGEVTVATSDPLAWGGFGSAPDGMSAGYAVRLLKTDVIVAVTVTGPVDRKEALVIAERLAESASARALKAGVGKGGGRPSAAVPTVTVG